MSRCGWRTKFLSSRRWPTGRSRARATSRWIRRTSRRRRNWAFRPIWPGDGATSWRAPLPLITSNTRDSTSSQRASRDACARPPMRSRLSSRGCAKTMRSIADGVWVHTDRATPPWLPEKQTVAEALRHRGNRYGYQGTATRRMRVTFAWNNMALAELRDLNRHRTGHRFTPLIQAGFYLPPEIDRAAHAALLEDQLNLTPPLLTRGSPAYLYSLLVGPQTPL